MDKKRLRGLAPTAIMAASAVAFALIYGFTPQQMRAFDLPEIITIAVVFIGSFFMRDFFTYAGDYARKNIPIAAVIVIFTGYLLGCIHRDTMAGSTNPFAITLLVLAAPFYSTLLLTGVRFISELVAELYAWLDAAMRKEVFIGVCAYSALNFYTHIKTAVWYGRGYFDGIYSIDTGEMFLATHDIRYFAVPHPLISLFTYPTGMLANLVAGSLAPAQYATRVEAVIFQELLLLLIILSGVMLWRLSGQRYFFRIYLCCAAPMLFAVALEKYPIAVFLLTAYVYCHIRKKDEAGALLIAAVGTMATSCFAGIFELFGNDIPLRERLRRVGRIVLGFIYAVYFSGCANEVFAYFSKADALRQDFEAELSFGERFKATLSMLEANILSLKASFSEGVVYYRWDDIGIVLPAAAVIIFVIVLLGFAVSYKECFARCCIFWIGFAFVLFVGFGWAAWEAPLFALYFVWACVPLFVCGAGRLAELLRIDKRWGSNVLCALLCLINLTDVITITMRFEGYV